MNTSPKLHCTKDYTLFEMHPCNRPLHKDAVLLASMKAHGYLDDYPIICVRNGNNKLQIVEGHHRFDCARRLGLPVWYKVSAHHVGLFTAEGGKSKWSLADFVFAYAKDGREEYQFLTKFIEDHGLPIGSAASLVGGESANSNNKIQNVKAGTFRVGDMAHANTVVWITDECRALGITFAATAAFVAAVSSVSRVPEFDGVLFLRRVSLYPTNLHKRATMDEYLEEIETVYNYSTKGTQRVPLAFRAREVASSRSAVQKHV
jgi:hypothetical protein